MSTALIVAVLLAAGAVRLIALGHLIYMEWTASGRAGKWAR